MVVIDDAVHEKSRFFTCAPHFGVMCPPIDVDAVEAQLLEHLEFFDQRLIAADHAELDRFLETALGALGSGRVDGTQGERARSGRTRSLQKIAAIERHLFSPAAGVCLSM